VDFTALGHASKFVLPGAFESNRTLSARGQRGDVDFQNPDGSIVLLVLNGRSSIAAVKHFLEEVLRFGQSQARCMPTPLVSLTI